MELGRCLAGCGFAAQARFGLARLTVHEGCRPTAHKGSCPTPLDQIWLYWDTSTQPTGGQTPPTRRHLSQNFATCSPPWPSCPELDGPQSSWTGAAPAPPGWDPPGPSSRIWPCPPTRGLTRWAVAACWTAQSGSKGPGQASLAREKGHVPVMNADQYCLQYRELLRTQLC